MATPQELWQELISCEDTPTHADLRFIIYNVPSLLRDEAWLLLNQLHMPDVPTPTPAKPARTVNDIMADIKNL